MSKILKAIKERRLIRTINNKIKDTIPVRYVDDWYTLEDIKQAKVLKRLKKKYGHVLKEKTFSAENCEESQYVWILWLQGEDAAPELVKACINSARKMFRSRKVMVLDHETVLKKINLPNYIVEKYANGVISNAHYSDILRAALLAEYGGIWIDSTVSCTAEKAPKFMEDAQLFVFKDIGIPLRRKKSIVASSWLIASKKKDPIMCSVYELLKEYWKHANRLDDYFLFHLFFTMAAEYYRSEWDEIPTYSNIPPHILQMELNDAYDEERWEQICGVSSFHKLSHHTRFDKDGTMYDHILKTMSVKNG